MTQRCHSRFCPCPGLGCVNGILGELPPDDPASESNISPWQVGASPHPDRQRRGKSRDAAMLMWVTYSLLNTLKLRVYSSQNAPAPFGNTKTHPPSAHRLHSDIHMYFCFLFLQELGINQPGRRGNKQAKLWESNSRPGCKHGAGEQHLAPRLYIKLLKEWSFSQRSFRQKEMKGGAERAESLVKSTAEMEKSDKCLLYPWPPLFSIRLFSSWEKLAAFITSRLNFPLDKVTRISPVSRRLH